MRLKLALALLVLIGLALSYRLGHKQGADMGWYNARREGATIPAAISNYERRYSVLLEECARRLVDNEFDKCVCAGVVTPLTPTCKPDPRVRRLLDEGAELLEECTRRLRAESF